MDLQLKVTFHRCKSTKLRWRPSWTRRNEPFHEITATFLRDADALYFNDGTLKEEQAC
jgi:hypothetical protein